MSEHLKQISKNIQNLTRPEKIVFGGVLLLIVSLFLPWFSIRTSDIFADTLAQTYIAFTGTTYIIGYLCYFLALISLNTIDKNLPRLAMVVTTIFFLLNVIFDKSTYGLNLIATFIFIVLNLGFLFGINHFRLIRQIPKYIVNIFTSIEALTLIFVSSMIYHRYSINFTDANLGFGLYLSSIGSFFMLYGAYLQFVAHKKKETKAIFAHPENHRYENIKLKPDLNIDTTENKQNNTQEQKSQSQLSLGDYE